MWVLNGMMTTAWDPSVMASCAVNCSQSHDVNARMLTSTEMMTLAYESWEEDANQNLERRPIVLPAAATARTPANKSLPLGTCLISAAIGLLRS